MAQNREYLQYAPIGASLAAVAAGAVTLNLYIIAFSSAMALACFVSYKLWDLIEAKVFEKTNMIQLFNGFEAGGRRLSATAKYGGRYISTTAARVETLGGVQVDREKIENMIANLGVPFKLVLHVKRINTVKLLEKLQTKKAMQEIGLSRLGGGGQGRNLLKANRLKASIAYLEHEIDEIRGGGVPIGLAYYLLTSAVSESRYRAEELSHAQLRELVSGFDATFGTRSSEVSGNDLINLMKFDAMMQ